MAISQNFPDVRPSLNLNFARSKTLDPRITFERASIGTYVDENGLIKTAAADEPRFDHDPETGESLGLLIEEQRTNLITYSDDISSWGASNVSVASVSVSNPFGYSSVYRVRGSSSLNRGHSISPGGSVPANTPHTTSVYVKGEGTGSDAGKIQLRINGIGYGVGVVNFDLFTNQSNTPEGLSGTSDSSKTWSINDYGMEFVGDDWYRIWMTHQSDNTSSVIVVTITSLSAKDNPSLDRIFWYTAPNTGGFYIAGAQLESGSFKTSVIPTSGSTLTRQLDIAQITGTNFTDFYNQNEGTWLCNFDYKGNNTSGASTLYSTALDQSDRNWLRINYTAGTPNTIRQTINSNTDDSQITISSNTLNKISQAYASGDQSVYINGSVAIESTRGISTNHTTLDIGNVVWSKGLNQTIITGTISKLLYYPERLSNAQLQNLTK